MFGKEMLDGMFGLEDEVSDVFAFHLGARLGRRNRYAATRLQVMKWWEARDWKSLRDWLLRDLPGEDPLPPRKRRVTHQ